jgi:hypothetical protein
MNEYLKISDIIINQDIKTPSNFEIKFSSNDTSRCLLRSLINTKIIKNCTLLENENRIIMKANSIKIYSELTKRELNYSFLLKMIYYLSRQLEYLIKKESKSFYTYEPNKIIVLDDNNFIYLGEEHLKDIKNNNLNIFSPIDRKLKYISPELTNIRTLPIIINYKTIFYSLGLIILNSISSLEEIKETKLYYFLKRCLNKNPNDRYLIYI